MDNQLYCYIYDFYCFSWWGIYILTMSAILEDNGHNIGDDLYEN